MSTYLSGKELTAAIIDQWQEVKRHQYNARLAKKELQGTIEKLSEYRVVEQAKKTLEDARLALKNTIEKSEDLKDMQEDIAYENAAVRDAKGVLSGLLVRQAVLSKNASVDLGEDNRHEIILQAVLGREAPEQMPLFGDSILTDDDGGIVAGNVKIKMKDDEGSNEK